jgi:hypothetical protein
MANIKKEAPQTTQENILNWLNFLEFLIFNIDENILDTKINEFQNILGNTVNDLKFKISSLLDTHNIFKAKYRAIGMIIHIIEDSYTVSHCKRSCIEEDLKIITFHCYSVQSATKHKSNDFILAENKDHMLNNINNVLIQLLNEYSAKNHYKNIFKLIDNDFLSSSDGGFA